MNRTLAAALTHAMGPKQPAMESAEAERQLDAIIFDAQEAGRVSQESIVALESLGVMVGDVNRLQDLLAANPGNVSVEQHVSARLTQISDVLGGGAVSLESATVEQVSVSCEGILDKIKDSVISVVNNHRRRKVGKIDIGRFKSAEKAIIALRDSHKAQLAKKKPEGSATINTESLLRPFIQNGKQPADLVAAASKEAARSTQVLGGYSHFALDLDNKLIGLIKAAEEDGNWDGAFEKAFALVTPFERANKDLFKPDAWLNNKRLKTAEEAGVVEAGYNEPTKHYCMMITPPALEFVDCGEAGATSEVVLPSAKVHDLIEVLGDYLEGFKELNGMLTKFSDIAMQIAFLGGSLPKGDRSANFVFLALANNMIQLNHSQTNVLAQIGRSAKAVSSLSSAALSAME